MFARPVQGKPIFVYRIDLLGFSLSVTRQIINKFHWTSYARKMISSNISKCNVSFFLRFKGNIISELIHVGKEQSGDAHMDKKFILHFFWHFQKRWENDLVVM